MSQMLKSSGAMAAATLTSRILGMVREMVYAAFMGNTWVASAFIMAFQVPNLFRRLLGEGALTAAKNLNSPAASCCTQHDIREHQLDAIGRLIYVRCTDIVRIRRPPVWIQCGHGERIWGA